MAGYGRSLLGSWDEDEFALLLPAQRYGSNGLIEAAPRPRDAFILPPPSATSTALPTLAAQADAPGAPLISPETVGNDVFERPNAVTFIDVSGDGAADKIARMLDADYAPPIIHDLI